MTYEQYLTLKPSQIPNGGVGLYTNVNIPKGANISRFIGNIVDEMITEKPNCLYLVETLDGKVMDVYPSKQKAKYANDAAGPRRIKGIRNNSYIEYQNEKIYIVASKNIKKGEEIFLSYGRAYWRSVFIMDEQSLSKYPS